MRLSNSAGWNDSDISFVADLEFLSGIEVYAWSVKDITPIFKNSSLRQVGIQCEFNSGADFQILKNLEVCKLFWRPKVHGLNRCTKIRHLNIVNYPYADLVDLASLDAMQRLQIDSKKLTSLRGIESMPRLRILDMVSCSKLSDVSPLAECGNLESIEFEACRNIYKMPDRLALDSLQEVSLIDCGKIKSLGVFAQCKNLRKLRFAGDTFVEDGDFNFLLELPLLQDVWYANRAHYSLTREELAARLFSNPSA